MGWPNCPDGAAGAKASGGQVGHPGVTLRQVAEPNQIVVHTPQVCPDCQADLATAPAVIRERRQVFELPPLGPVVIEHQVRQVCCPQCQRLTVSQFPPDVTQPVQYGAAVKSLAVYLQEYQHLPFARAQELFQDVLQFPLSEGTLANASGTVAAGVQSQVAVTCR